MVFVNYQTLEVDMLWSGDVYETNKLILEHVTSNCKMVTVKQDRTCKRCENTIAKGTKCYTFNKKYQGRSWICFDCIQESGTEVRRQVGEDRRFYSEFVDEFGRHKTKGQMDDYDIDAWEDYLYKELEEIVYDKRY